MPARSTTISGSWVGIYVSEMIHHFVKNAYSRIFVELRRTILSWSQSITTIIHGIIRWSLLSEMSRSIKEVQTLSKLERLIIEYFIRHISAGEIIAVLDLKEEVKKRVKQGESDLIGEIEDAIIVKELYITMAMLVRKGFLNYRNGVYKLADWIINIIKAKKGGLYPGIQKSLNELLD